MNQHRANVRTMRDVFSMLFRHKKKMFLFSTLVMAATVAGVIFAPRKYESTAGLFFRIGRQSVGLDPTASTGPMIAVNDSTDSEMNSALEVIESRALAERVVDRIGLDAFSGPSTGQSSMPAWFVNFKDSVHSLDEITPREAAVNDVQSALTIATPKRSRIITIRTKADSPQLAQQISSSVVEEFLKMHLQLNSTRGTKEFFEKQTSVVKEQLEKATNRLRDLKNEASMGTIEASRTALASRLQTVESDRLLAEANIASSQGRAVSLADALGKITERVSTDEIAGFDNGAADQMRQQLYGLELKEMELTAKYTDSHPLVIEVRQQLDSAKKVMGTMPAARTRLTTTLNPTFQQLDVERARELAAVRSNKDRIAQLDETRASLLAEQRKLNDVEIEVAQLSRTIDGLNTSYRNYSEKLEQTRIDTVANDERISNVNIAQEATFVEKPVSPNKAIVVALGLFVAIFGSIGLAFVCEFVDESFKTPGDVEACLDVPVLLSIPRVRRHNVLLN